jgi:hypothetical protein
MAPGIVALLSGNSAGIAARRPYLKVRVCPAAVGPHTDFIVFAIAVLRLIALIAINLTGDGLRDALDPKMRRS